MLEPTKSSNAKSMLTTVLTSYFKVFNVAETWILSHCIGLRHKNIHFQTCKLPSVRPIRDFRWLFNTWIRSINKKCVNFDKFTEWRKANTIDMDKYVKVMQMPEGDKPGIKQHPAADQYYEYWGFDNPNHKPKPEGHGLPLDEDSNL